MTGSHEPSNQRPSSVHWRLKALLQEPRRFICCETVHVKFHFDDKSQLHFCLTMHAEWLLLCFSVPVLIFGWLYVYAPLWLVGHMVSRFAFVFAEGAHFKTRLIATFGLQHSTGHRRRHGTAELTQSLRKRPQTVLHTGQSVISAFRRATDRTNQINTRKYIYVLGQ